MSISQVAVIGAGTMGSGIASHLANADVPVVLLDLVPEGANDRNVVADSAVVRQLKASPPGFVHPDKAALIQTGNVEDHLDLIAHADWIVEAVVEQLDVKHALYRRLDALRKPGSIVASNTSTIPLRMLVDGMPEQFERDFCITHFFNPVRYMRLLELVPGVNTRKDAIDTLALFCDQKLGKGVVHCKDTPGFLGNRVGVFALQVGLVEAQAHALTIEEADVLMGRPMGIPKTGVFGLYDLIGLDLMLDVVKSLHEILPATDPFQAVADGIACTTKLVERGHKGVKSGAGFYRTRVKDDARISEAVDLSTGEYRPASRPSLDAAAKGEQVGLAAMVAIDDKYGRYARRVLARVLAYAASIVPEASNDIVAIDEAMKLGYGWAKGPFELIDELGTPTFADCLRAEGINAPPLIEAAAGRALYDVAGDVIRHVDAGGAYRPLERGRGILRLGDLKRIKSRVLGNDQASLWDIGDGVAACEFHSKANALSPQSMEILQQSVAAVASDFKALVIGSDAPHYSVGFNIEFVLDCARSGDFAAIERGLEVFHASCMDIRNAPFPVVSAAAGMALGGGYEVVLHSDATVVHSNTVLGLVEPMVGVVPSGGGCKEMLARWTREPGDEPIKGAAKAYAMIISGTTAGSPEEAAPLRLITPADKSTMNRDRMLHQAKKLALEMADGYSAPAERTFPVLGRPAREAMAERLRRFDEKGLVTPHDHVVSEHLAHVLSGGGEAGESISERGLLDLERAAFIELVRTRPTQERIAHMLQAGRPLRN